MPDEHYEALELNGNAENEIKKIENRGLGPFTCIEIQSGAQDLKQRICVGGWINRISLALISQVGRTQEIRQRAELAPLCDRTT